MEYGRRKRTFAWGCDMTYPKFPLSISLHYSIIVPPSVLLSDEDYSCKGSILFNRNQASLMFNCWFLLILNIKLKFIPFRSDCMTVGVTFSIETRPISISRVLRANSDGPTDRRTDKVAYRVACTRLKKRRIVQSQSQAKTRKTQLTQSNLISNFIRKRLWSHCGEMISIITSCLQCNRLIEDKFSRNFIHGNRNASSHQQLIQHAIWKSLTHRNYCNIAHVSLGSFWWWIVRRRRQALRGISSPHESEVKPRCFSKMLM